MVWIAVLRPGRRTAALPGRHGPGGYLSVRKRAAGQVCLFASAEELLDYKYASFGVCLVNVEAPLHLEAGRDIKERLPQTALVFYGRGQEPAWAPPGLPGRGRPVPVPARGGSGPSSPPWTAPSRRAASSGPSASCSTPPRAW